MIKTHPGFKWKKFIKLTNEAPQNITSFQMFFPIKMLVHLMMLYGYMAKYYKRSLSMNTEKSKKFLVVFLIRSNQNQTFI